MNRLDRYQFKELLVPFCIGAVGSVLLLAALRFYGLAEMVSRERWGAAQIARVIGYDIPTVLVMALPVATALGSSLATGRLARDNEITVLRGTGAPLSRIFRAHFAFGIVVALVNLWLADQVVPGLWKAQRGMFSPALARQVEGGMALRSGPDLISFASLQRLNSDRVRVTTLLLSRADGAIVTAPTAEYEAGLWRLNQAVVHTYRPDGGLAGETAPGPLTIRLPLEFDRAVFSLHSDQLANLSFAELSRGAAEARRRGERKKAIEMEVNRWFKLALPAMCATFALLAPPLVLRFSRAGSFAGVLLAILTVFVAWNTLLLMKYLALGGFWFLPPLVAALTTNVLFTLLGLVLLRQLE